MTDALKDYQIAARDFAAKLDALAITVACAFVPFSQSRNRAEKSPSLNWRCAVKRNGKPVSGLASVDYMQGSGHAPASKTWGKDNRFVAARAVAMQCETGKHVPHASFIHEPSATGKPISAPSAADIMSALVLDSDVLNYSTFEDWADCFGYEQDSRSAEKTYRACLATALALRGAIGEDNMQTLAALANEM